MRKSQVEQDITGAVLMDGPGILPFRRNIRAPVTDRCESGVAVQPLGLPRKFRQNRPAAQCRRMTGCHCGLGVGGGEWWIRKMAGLGGGISVLEDVHRR
jgi:hypothetical protein